MSRGGTVLACSSAAKFYRNDRGMRDLRVPAAARGRAGRRTIKTRITTAVGQHMTHRTTARAEAPADTMASTLQALQIGRRRFRLGRPGRLRNAKLPHQLGANSPRCERRPCRAGTRASPPTDHNRLQRQRRTYPPPRPRHNRRATGIQ
jgi:hypothetical protein